MKHKDFYSFVAAHLTEARKNQNITRSQLANMVDEQYNTIVGIERGKRFSAHHLLWIEPFIGKHLSKIYKQGVHGDKEEILSLFI